MNKNVKLSIIYGLLIISFSLAALFWGGNLEHPNIITILWGMAPLIASISLRIIVKDWKDIGLKPNFKKNMKWYLFSVFIFPLVFFAIIFVGELLGFSQIKDFEGLDFIKKAGIGFLVFALLAFIEETGWRGFLVPKLSKAGISSPWISIFVGIIWALWHFPFYKAFVGFSDPNFSYYSFPVFIMECIALSFVYTEIRLISNSIIPAVLFHATCNAIGHPFAADYLNVINGKTYFGTIGYNIIPLIVLFVMIGLWLKKYRYKSLQNN